MKGLLLVLSLFVITTTCFGQSPVKSLVKYFDDIEDNNSTVPTEIFSDRKNENNLVSKLELYSTSTSKKTRSAYFSILSRIGQNSSSNAIRIRAVDLISVGISDSSVIISTSCVNALKNFLKNDFSSTAQAKIIFNCTASNPNVMDIMKIIGFLKLDMGEEKIKHVIRSSKNFSVRWAGHLALVRLGNQSALDYVLAKLENAEMNNETVYEVVPDLIYTRNNKVFIYLQKQLLNEQKSCLSADPNNPAPIQCGYRLMEYMAPVITNFPLKRDENGMLEISDYKLGLEELKTWIKKGNDFKLDRLKY